MKNLEVAGLLDKLGEMGEAGGEDRFKVIAYHRAATSIRNLDEDVEVLWREKKLEEIKFVGQGIAKKIEEYFRTGRIHALDDLTARVPQGVPMLMKVQGIGPRTAYRLAHDFGVSSVEGLKRALESGVLDNEFGPAVRHSFLIGIEKLESFQRSMLLPEAEGVFQELSAYFGALGIEVAMGGSLRRGKSTVGDIDILSTDKRTMDAIDGCPGVTQVLEKGPKRASVRLEQGAKVDVRVFDEEEYGAALVYFTGSKDHNIALRNLAIARGWKLNEYGLFDKNGRRLAGVGESDVYEKLGMQYIPPELRENRGEIEAAKNGSLPRLVKSEEIRGDMQMHTIWSDGSTDVGGMARAAKARGYDYISITDHSVSVRVAHGLTEERFRKQWKEIDKINEELAPFRVLKGVEMEIRGDGSLDFDNKFLEGFDIVGASLHQRFGQVGEKLTERAVSALSHPKVNLLCHPTNRLLGRREENPIDLEKVIRTAKDNGKVLEIDGEPRRLDLDDVWARKAIDAGVPLLVDSDAHDVGELDNIMYGVLVARRAWAEAKNVMNTLRLKDLLKALR